MRSVNRTWVELQELLPDYLPGDPIPDDGLLKTSIDGLLPGVNYTICTTVFTEVGDGPEHCSWAATQNAGKGSLLFL